MKRVKGLFLLAAVVTMALAFAGAVYAEDKTYADLSVSDKAFYSNNASDLGVYPVIEGMDDTNAKTLSFVQKSYWNMPGYNDSSFTRDKFFCSYEVENSDAPGRYAKVTLSIRAYLISSTQAKDDAFVNVVYVDKEGMKEITEADYTDGIKAEAEEAAAVPEEEAEEASTEMALRTNVALAGYTMDFDTESGVITIIADKTYTLTLNENKYPGIGGKKIELEFAPKLQDGVLVVPSEFFTDILGLTVKEVEGKLTVVK